GDGSQPVCNRCMKSKAYCDRSVRTTASIQAWRPPSHDQDPNASFPTPDSPRKALETSRIAQYFQHYIKTIAPWYDLSDQLCTFATEVPSKALDEPLLFGAIIALSAVHLSKTTAPKARTAADFYHGYCVRTLIELEPGDRRVKSGVALASTCLLRSYEILAEEQDPNRHLHGAYSLASERSLCADSLCWNAGFWNYLREDITFSLFTGSKLKTDLKHTPDHVLITQPDYLNQMSILLGNVVNACFGDVVSDDEWDHNLATLRQQSMALPTSFQAFSRALGSGLSSVDCIPSVWMVQACHGGKFIRNEACQQELIRRLYGSRAMTGWPVQRTIDSLQQDWGKSQKSSI
ncbi:hypothetical protein M406DRAFT_246706, partial [Cryphonectria parasitica EP155]